MNVCLKNNICKLFNNNDNIKERKQKIKKKRLIGRVKENDENE